MQTFPRNLLRENGTLWELTAQVITPGSTASGVMPVTRTDGGGIWKCTLSDIPLVTADQVRAWRAFTAYAEGGAQPFILEQCDRRHAPVPTVNGQLLAQVGVPHDDETPHSDGTPYESGTVSAVLGNGNLRATQILIVVFNGAAPLRGGEHFSIDHGDPLGDRLYRIVSVTPTVDGPLCDIRPPLRAPVGGGAHANFDHPRCVMRLASPDAMDLRLTLRKFGNPTASFFEAFPPYPAGT